MLVEAVNWPPARNHGREHILAFPDFAHYVTGWPRDGDLGVSVGRENLARRLYLDEGYRVVPAGSASDPESETMIKDL
jgi:hypothetical protein